jgi:thioredoxin-like negative regulator of GroEL
VDELKELVEEFGVTSTPTVQLFKNGQRVDECVTPGPHALLQFIAHAQE